MTQLAMPHRTVRGQIRYTSKKPGLEDMVRGGEWFSFTHHGDGSVILNAHCEIAEPDPVVMRDIIYAIGPDGRPRNCHVHLMVGDRFMGSGWFGIDAREDGGTIQCESNGPGIGRLSQRIDYVGPIDGFGTHPIAGDAYMTRCMDLSRGPHARTIRCFLPSPDHRGATPPMAAEVTIDLEYKGEESVTVAAGTFDCRRFAFVDRGAMGGNQHPAYDMWVTADDDAVFVQGGVGGYMATWYELIALER
ncbi:hypothetical protein [Blastomonas sp.]|uniref:hypothetical protein n=1 Tax=Blastomonas sp. TaxID=1909299 RepID=UPI0035935084